MYIKSTYNIATQLYNFSRQDFHITGQEKLKYLELECGRHSSNLSAFKLTLLYVNILFCPIRLRFVQVIPS